jgi:hypothetical protein
VRCTYSECKFTISYCGILIINRTLCTIRTITEAHCWHERILCKWCRASVSRRTTWIRWHLKFRHCIFNIPFRLDIKWDLKEKYGRQRTLTLANVNRSVNINDSILSRLKPTFIPECTSTFILWDFVLSEIVCSKLIEYSNQLMLQIVKCVCHLQLYIIRNATATQQHSAKAPLFVGVSLVQTQSLQWKRQQIKILLSISDKEQTMNKICIT